MESKKGKLRKVRTCRVHLVVPSEHTNRIEDMFSSLSHMVNTNREVSDSDVDCILKRIDKLSDSVLRIGYISLVVLLISCFCLISNLV